MENYTIIFGICIILLTLWSNNRHLYTIKKENYIHLKKIKKMNLKAEKLRLASQAVIQRPIKKRRKKITVKKLPEHVEKMRYITISSGDRDLKRFPNAADFEYNFGETIKNIKSIELNKFSMTKSMYPIDDHNSKMIIRDLTTDIKYVISITNGFHSIGSYMKELNKNFEDNNMDLRIYFDSIAHTVTLKNEGVDTIYKILYSTEEFEETNFNSIGFTADDFILNPQESKTGSRRVDLFGATNITIQMKNVSYGYNDNILGNVLVRENVITTYENDNDRPRREISPLITLNKIGLTTTFKPAYKSRRYYEFNGIEFTAVIEVVTLERKMPFEQIITRYN